MGCGDMMKYKSWQITYMSTFCSPSRSNIGLPPSTNGHVFSG